MARKIRVKASGLGSAVMEVLTEYTDEVTGKAMPLVEVVAREVAGEVRQNAVSAGIGGTKYKNAISVKVARGRLLSTATVYSPKHYQLTHMLEHGHVLKAHGKVVGRTRPFPHWAKAEKEAENKIVTAIKKVV